MKSKRYKTAAVISAILLICTAFAFLPQIYINAQSSGWNTLVTSYNPEYYCKLQTSGNTVTVTGKYSDDRPEAVGISKINLSGYEFKAESDGSFAAKLTGSPLAGGYYYFYVQLKSGLQLTYLLQYDGGWIIPDNGLCELNAEHFNNILTADPKAAAYYLSADADPDEIAETLQKLQNIVDYVCKGVDDDYEKARLLNLWVGEHIYYDHDAAETSVTLETVAIHNVLETYRTTCAGFANTYCALLELAGIRSVNLKGAAAAGAVTYSTLTTGVENHEFSAFWYEEQQRWVYVDACWTSNNDYENGEYSSGAATEKYFDVTGEAFSLNHRVDKAEERLYTEALDAVLNNETKETEEPDEAADNSESSSESSSSEPEEAPEAADLPSETTSEASSAAASDPDENTDSSDTVLYIIIGALGIAAVAAGVLLAVRSRR